MSIAMRTSTVTVKRLPDTVSREQADILLRELTPRFNVNRPCLVIDCSNLRRLDANALHLLLCCLEEAMKRNGDVRLAGVSPEARAILKSTGVDRLFTLFDSSTDAERSFDRARHGAVPHDRSHYASSDSHQ